MVSLVVRKVGLYVVGNLSVQFPNVARDAARMYISRRLKHRFEVILFDVDSSGVILALIPFQGWGRSAIRFHDSRHELETLFRTKNKRN